MWAEINGERKKVACGPCIRGHRSSKCDHRDRVLVEVRKPGRPLSSCPHPTGSCSCERVVINYTIPKTSECACPSERGQPAIVSNSSGRVQKRSRKSSTFNPSILEKAIKAGQDQETDSSTITRTPTSESNNDASPPSSASSTPRMLPSRKQSNSLEIPKIESSTPSSRPATAQPQGPSSCCQPKPVQAPSGSCCGNKTKEAPKPVQPKKSCCSGPVAAQQQQPQFAPPSGQFQPGLNFNGFPQYSGQLQHAPFSGNNYMQMPLPFNFNTPIYNHLASAYQPPTTMPLPIGNHSGTHATEHNCHCGDSCSCFGCAAHPNNATMIEYMRSMHEFMSTGQFGALPPPVYDMPSRPHHAGYGAEAQPYNNNISSSSFLATSQMSFHANLNAPMSLSHVPINVSSPWSQPQSSVQSSAQAPPLSRSQFFTNEATSNATQEATLTVKSEDSVQSPTSVDSPSEGKEEETATLSPSSFFWQEMVLPGCNDATGTCQCGDGCECVGCLTHGGHNGVPLELPTSGEQETFPDFVSPNAMDSSDQLLSFQHATT